MKIEIETKFNVDDRVFTVVQLGIESTRKYYALPAIIHQIYVTHAERPSIKSVSIIQYLLKLNVDGVMINDDIVVTESKVYSSFDEAQEKADSLNERM